MGCTYHFDTQCASSTATATTLLLRGADNSTSLHSGMPITASGEENRMLHFPGIFRLRCVATREGSISSPRELRSIAAETPLFFREDTWLVIKDIRGDTTKTVLLPWMFILFNLKNHKEMGGTRSIWTFQSQLEGI